MGAPALADYSQGLGAVSADNLNTFMQTANVAGDLRAFTGTTGIEVYLRGIITANDGLGGAFYWDAAATAADDGVNIIAPSGAPVTGRWVRQLGIARQAPPVTVSGANYTVASSDYALLFNAMNTAVVLPVASTYSGRILIFQSLGAYTISSSAANVVPLGAAAPGTQILAATDGKFAMLQSDGSNWITLMAN